MESVRTFQKRNLLLVLFVIVLVAVLLEVRIFYLMVPGSGRLSAAAAFVGELLGLKPVINIIDGESHVPEKIRGEKNIMPKLIETAKKNMIPQTPYIVLAGSMEDVTSAFEKEITKALGYPPEYTAKIGITVASHAGPKVIGLIFKGQKRR